MDKHRDKFDAILDGALRGYSTGDARAGLEKRILARIQTAPSGRQLRWPLLCWTLVPAAVIVIALLLILRHSDLPLTQRVVETPSVPESAAPIIETGRAQAPRPHKRGRAARFPVPLPLTAEERALLRFVQDQPELARVALFQSAQIEKLTIEPLSIEALQSETEEQHEENN